MKTTKLFLLSALMFFFCANLHAQVTMGGLEEPKSGAILDLNSTTKGGLLLSNVVLGNLYTIPYTDANSFPGVDDGNYGDTGVKDGFTGAIVYHTGENGFSAGVYLWNGDNWSPAGEDCRALTADDLTLTGLPFAKVGASVSFSVSSKLSDRCSEGETYTWSASPSPGTVTFTPSSGAATSAVFSQEGEYTLTVTAQNPYMPATITKTLTVTVNNDGSIPVTLLDGLYGIVGPVCLDAKVKKQPATQSDEAFAARVDAFASTADYTKTYRFVHNDIYSNLHLILLDPAGLVESMTAPDEAVPVMGAEKEKAFTLTFRPDIKTVVPSDGDSLTVKLIATYTNNSGLSKIAYLEIRVEDGTCICPAKTSTGPDTWMNFMCHNLGGLDIISSSQLITYEHHGDWYRFGAKYPSLVNNGTNNGSQDWTYGSSAVPTYYTEATSYAQNSGSWDWPDALANYEDVIGNPCPAGWRLPAITELAAVVNKNTSDEDITVINPLTNVPATWLTASNQTFSNLKKSGDYLYLPAVGYREGNIGNISNRGYYGYYWSSTSNNNYTVWCIYFYSGSQYVFGTDPSYGFSVRCVQAE